MVCPGYHSAAMKAANGSVSHWAQHASADAISVVAMLNPEFEQYPSYEFKSGPAGCAVGWAEGCAVGWAVGAGQ